MLNLPKLQRGFNDHTIAHRATCTCATQQLKWRTSNIDSVRQYGDAPRAPYPSITVVSIFVALLMSPPSELNADQKHDGWQLCHADGG